MGNCYPDDRANLLPPGGRFGYAILVANLDKGNPSEFSWLNDLNSQQQAAAKASEGPVLVVAGAGTGETKTLAYRFAHLVCMGVNPGRIMPPYVNTLLRLPDPSSQPTPEPGVDIVHV